jgi:hypothetical protein
MTKFEYTVGGRTHYKTVHASSFWEYIQAVTRLLLVADINSLRATTINSESQVVNMKIVASQNISTNKKVLISISQLGWFGLACGLIGALTAFAGIWFGSH